MTRNHGCCLMSIWRITLIPAALLAFFLWYLVRQQKTASNQSAPTIKLPPVESIEKEKPVAAKPAAPRKGDDLTRIDGVGPKAAAALKAAGINNFSALAEASPEQLKQMLSDAGMRIVNPESWQQQAKFAAAGDWEGLAAFNARRKGAAGKS